MVSLSSVKDLAARPTAVRHANTAVSAAAIEDIGYNLHPSVPDVCNAIRLMSAGGKLEAFDGGGNDIASVNTGTPISPSRVSTINSSGMPFAGSCNDDPAFLDAKGFNCASWSAYDCSNHATYSQEERAQVQVACPKVCSLCKEIPVVGSTFRSSAGSILLRYTAGSEVCIK